jgi:hypothetical protein
MSYSEENGQVVLRMSRYDFLFLRRVLGEMLAGEWGRSAESTKQFLNRLNSGNPNYTPYQVEEKRGQR